MFFSLNIFRFSFKLNWMQILYCSIILGVFDEVKANHVLVNEYLAGQGIMAHTDGPLFHPIICTISCGSHTILQFHEHETTISTTDDNSIDIQHRKLVCQLLIEPRSLLILKDDMYNMYLHSIANETHDIITPDLANLEQCNELKNRVGGTIGRNRRISLTIRHVPKTSKIHLRLGHWYWTFCFCFCFLNFLSWENYNPNNNKIQSVTNR